MSFLSLEMNTFLMFLLMFLGIMTGYQLGFVLAGVGLFFGVSMFGFRFMGALTSAFISTVQNYTLLAIPLFVLMGNIMMQSGAGDRIFNSLYILLGRVRGGLAIATTILATLFAACTGVVGASVVTVGTLGIPAMLTHKYDRKIAFGTVCSGGCLGVLIPPSILIVVYGPTASLPVGNLFIAAITPGLLLSLCYILYVVIRCWFDPDLGPTISEEERKEALSKTSVLKLISAIVPPVVIILAVLGSIFFGVAAPTEAAAVGCLASILLAMSYGQLNLKNLKKATLETLVTTSSILIMTVGAVMFISTFTSMGGVDLVKRIVLGLPLGPLGIFLLMAAIVTILGMFIDWVGIVYLCVPIYTPIAASLGFNPVWFATMMILFIQFSYLTPPFALSCFYCKSIAPKDTTIGELYKAVLPYIGIQLFVFTICYIFPSVILFLPGLIGK
jgi:tripartite ATP-independent transporter DctM subunit